MQSGKVVVSMETSEASLKQARKEAPFLVLFQIVMIKMR